jgi:hypothetical protein
VKCSTVEQGLEKTREELASKNKQLRNIAIDEELRQLRETEAALLSERTGPLQVDSSKRKRSEDSA